MSFVAEFNSLPLEALVKKFSHQRFEPNGMTSNPDIPFAKSIVDYVFRWMALQFIQGYREAQVGGKQQPELGIPGLEDEEKRRINRPVPGLLSLNTDTEMVVERSKSGNGGNGHGPSPTQTFVNQQDAPSCPNCGHLAVRNGACYKCLNCGESLGCS